MFLALIHFLILLENDSHLSLLLLLTTNVESVVALAGCF